MAETNDTGRNSPQVGEATDGLRGHEEFEYVADELFRGRREVVIRYREARYRLRITRSGKLILTK